jgi:hypothetical protein
MPKIVHITVGNEKWTPTYEELVAILDIFQRTLAANNAADKSDIEKIDLAADIIVTREGVKYEVIDAPDPDQLRYSFEPSQTRAAISHILFEELLNEANTKCPQEGKSNDYTLGFIDAMSAVRDHIEEVVKQNFPDHPLLKQI